MYDYNIIYIFLQGSDGMNIEKLNDNQIKATLYQSDLDKWNIRISDLASGSPQAKEVLKEMIIKASEDLDFHIDNVPLVVEAVPVSPDKLVLVVTKVESPDALLEKVPLINNLLNLDIEIDEDELPGEHDKKEKTQEEVHCDCRLYYFDELEDVCKMASCIRRFYKGSSSMYKDSDTGEFYLILEREGQDPKAFDEACSVASEYGHHMKATNYTKAFFDEHFRCIFAEDALKMLDSLL